MAKFTISTHETDPSTAVVVDKLEYATGRAAIEDAKIALGDTARESLRGRTHAGFHTEVRDGSGKVLFRASLTFASHTAMLSDETPAQPAGTPQRRLRLFSSEALTTVNAPRVIAFRLASGVQKERAMGGGIIFVPWYEVDDYYQLRPANDKTGLTPSYDEWLRAAIQEVTHLLAAGNAIQIVRLRPDPYFEWLATRCAPDTVEERLAYLSDVTARSGCVDRRGTLACPRRQAHTRH